MIVLRFHPSKVVTKAITLSIRQQFGNPWPTMGSNSRRSSQTTFRSEELDRSAYVDEEDFEARLSEARFDATSSVGESQITPLDPTEEERLRTRCSVVAAGTKRKGCLRGTGELAHTYKCGDDCFMQHMQGSSNHAQDSIEIN
ncbi:hypothetical protein HKD37_01G001235 [Glycine soja]